MSLTCSHMREQNFLEPTPGYTLKAWKWLLATFELVNSRRS